MMLRRKLLGAGAAAFGFGVVVIALMCGVKNLKFEFFALKYEAFEILTL
jgi:hypothetical protein